MRMYGVDRITDIQEVDYLEVCYGSDVSDIDGWPIFGEEEEESSFEEEDWAGLIPGIEIEP